MIRIRHFEEAAGQLLASGRAPGFIHLSIGQEAVAAGVCGCLDDEDMITSTHRGHGHCIAKGGKLDRMMAELLGKPEGYCLGRSGSMHIADPAVGILGANAIVGGGIAMATGAALSAQIRETGTVVVAFFGEGAVAEGVFHECMNLASLWKLPIIFVCENNQYAELSPVSVHLSAPSVAAFGDAYGIPASTHDGNDLLAVIAATEDAVSHARAGHGPSLLEFETYRLRGHFEGDQQAYRSREEVQLWAEKDPIERFALVLRDEYGVAADTLEHARVEIAGEVTRAVEWAEALPDPDPSLLTKGVYHSDIGDAAPPRSET